ncbi:kinase-like domain-containing protein, partial [Scleroderma citrinum]
QEVHLWSKLHHANITKLLGFVTEFDSAFSMVSEWMPKGNAYQYVQDQDVDPRPLLLDIANGLVYLHTHESGPIYHGGLKGFNVLISDDGRALLTGFGSACSSSSSFCVTYPAVYGGLLQHSPPESLSNEDYEPSAAGDIWSFGMTALELFTRMPPFHTKRTVQSLFLRILRGPPDRPSDDATCFRLSNEWWDICMSCWKTESAFRPNASDIVKKIGQINVCARISGSLIANHPKPSTFRILIKYRYIQRCGNSYPYLK